MRVRSRVFLGLACGLLLAVLLRFGTAPRTALHDATHQADAAASPVDEPPPRRREVGVAAAPGDSSPALPAEPTQVVGPDGAALGGLGEDPRAAWHDGLGRHVVWVTRADDSAATPVLPNPEGRFHLRGFAPDALLVLRVTRNDAPSTLLVADGQYRARELAGAVVAFREAPATRVRIACRDTRDSPVTASFRIERAFASARHTVARVETDDVGRAELDVAGDGRFYAVLETSGARPSPAFSPLEIPFDVRRASGPPELQVVLPAPADLRVAVVDANGEPLGAALVNLWFEDDGVAREHPDAGWTDATGLRRFSRLAPGRYAIQATAPGHLPGVLTATLSDADDQSVRITLAEGGAGLRGRLTSDGTPLSLAPGSAFLLLRGTRPESTFALWTVEPEDAGGFRARGLPPGDYELNLLGKHTGVVIRFTVDTEDLDLGSVDIGPARTESGGTVSLSVATNAPPAMRVKALFRNDNWSPLLWRSVQLNCSGAAQRVERLAPGNYRFEISPAALDGVTFDITRAATVTVYSSPGDTAPTVVLEMPRRK